MSPATVVLAGGGSGGHISPGLALAEAIETADQHIASHFACSTRAIDAHMINAANRTWTALPATPPGLTPHRAWKFARGFIKSSRRATQMFEEHQVRAVILLGGYVSVPVAHAAKKCNIPTILLNLDSVPGRANRWLRSRVDEVLSAVPTRTPMSDTITGMPIRKQAQPPAEPEVCRKQLGLDPERATLVITGASQGATTINQLASDLAQHHASLLDHWQVIHLTGTDMRETMAQRWAESGVPARVESFRHDMGVVWGAASVAMSRAGACSVAEISYAGLPAIYLPYPHHRDQHQRHNAAPAVEAGAALIVEDRMQSAQTLPDLLRVLGPLLQDPHQLEQLRQAAQTHRGSNAADVVACRVLNRLK